MRLLVAMGGALTLISSAALAFGYAPTLFIRSDAALETLGIDAACAVSTNLEVKARFADPAPLASTVAVNFNIDNIARCERYWIAAKGTATVKLFSSEAVFAGEQREIRRDVPFKAGTTPGSRIFEFDTKGLNQHWFAVIEHPLTAYRTGFDGYGVAGNLSLGLGEWTFTAGNATNYATSGETELKRTVTSQKRPEDNEFAVHVTATFPSVTEFKDVYLLILSTVLGVAVSTLIQGAAAPPKLKRGRSTRSAADA